MNRRFFFDTVRPIFPDKRLTISQVNGINAILDAFEADPSPLDQQAYMLATAFHETAYTMQPVRETRAATDKEAIAILDRAWANGRLPWVKSPYWRLDKDGKSWLGRGLVQITHKFNYEKLSPIVGVDLVRNPSAALEMPVALKIMIEGMRRGIFTGKALKDYFDGVDEGDAEDYREMMLARRIINGTDRAADIARHGLTFEKALKGGVA